jgi:hypothetical protein
VSGADEDDIDLVGQLVRVHAGPRW